MFTTDAMDRYIDQSAQAFIKEKTPLNDTITKIASEHGLNRDQISRVVEGANTEVYVQLMNQSTDKYINFENASAEKVASAVHGTIKTAEIITSDYDDPPTPEPLTGSFMEKVAEDERRLDQAEVHNQAIKLAGLDEQIGNSLDEVDVRFQQNSDVLYHLIKQAYLGGTSFGDICVAVSTVYDSPVINQILDDCYEKLAFEIHPGMLITDIQNHGSVNSENPMIKQAGNIMKDVTEFKILREKRAEVYEGMKTCVEKFPDTKHLLKLSFPQLAQALAKTAPVAAAAAATKSGFMSNLLGKVKGVVQTVSQASKPVMAAAPTGAMAALKSAPAAAEHGMSGVGNLPLNKKIPSAVENAVAGVKKSGGGVTKVTKSSPAVSGASGGGLLGNLTTGQKLGLGVAGAGLFGAGLSIGHNKESHFKFAFPQGPASLQVSQVLAKAAPAVEGAIKSTKQVGLSKVKKLGLTLGVGAIGGIGYEKHMSEYHKNQANMPMGGIAPQFVR